MHKLAKISSIENLDEIKKQFISSNASIMDLSRKYKLSSREYYSLVRFSHREGWRIDRKQYRANVNKKIIDQLPQVMADKWSKQRESVLLAHEGLLATLKKYQDQKTGKMRPIPPHQVRIIIDAVESAVKTISFMDGGPTERTEGKSLNIYVDLMDAIRERNAKHNVDDSYLDVIDVEK